MIESEIALGNFSITMEESVAKEIVVLYHANCVDGFASAYICWRKFGDDKADYFAVQYGEIPPAHVAEYKEVYIVDFSYKRDVLNLIAKDMKKVHVWDHHKTAMAELCIESSDSQSGYIKHPELAENIEVVFDMSMSGAQICWFILNPGVKEPAWVTLIGMRDLWKHKLPENKKTWELNCEEFNAAINSYPRTFERWDDWFKRENYLFDNIQILFQEGEAINRFVKQQVDNICKNSILINARFGIVPIVQTNLFQSEVGNQLCIGYVFSMSWFINKQGYVVCSLRSDQNSDTSLDVSTIAKFYGGGGHKHAAEFTMNFDEFKSRFLDSHEGLGNERRS